MTDLKSVELKARGGSSPPSGTGGEVVKQLGKTHKEQGLILRLQTCNPERPETSPFLKEK